MGDDKKCSCIMHIIIALIVGFLLGGLIVYLFKTNDISISMTTTPPTPTKKDKVDDNMNEVEGFKNIPRNKISSKEKKPKRTQGKKLIWKGKQTKFKKKMSCNC